MNERLKAFLQLLPKHGIEPTLLWERPSWDADSSVSPSPVYRCYLFKWLGTEECPQSVPMCGIFADYGCDGYAFFPEARTNTQRGDLAIITGQSETALEIAGGLSMKQVKVNSRQFLRDIINLAEECLEHADAGGRRQYAFDLFANDLDLSGAAETLADFATEISEELGDT